MRVARILIGGWTVLLLFLGSSAIGAEFSLTAYQGKHYLPVHVNGQDAGMFLIDTGSSVTTIHPRIAQRVQFKALGRKPLNSFQGDRSHEFGTIGQLQAGTWTCDNLIVFVSDVQSSLPNGLEVNGVLGMNVLGQSAFTIDFRNQRLTIHAPVELKLPADASMDLQRGVDTPRVRGSVEGREGWFEIDTGYSDTILLTRPFVELNAELVVDRPQIRTALDWSEQSSAYNMRWKSADVLGEHHDELFGQYDADGRFGTRLSGLIGVGVLRDRKLTIDWTARKAWCRKLPDEPLNELLARLRDPSRRDLAASSPLVQAAFLKRLDAVTQLLAEGESTESTDARGYTALMIAAARDRVDIIDTLLARGAKVDTTAGDEAHTALHFAAWFGRTDAATRLLAAGADVNAAAKESRRTPLFIAAEAGDVELVQLLLAHSANIDATLSDGETPLLAACSNGTAEVVRLLLDRRANPNATGKRGTCLSYAAMYSSPACVELLLARGADPNKTASEGPTPLMAAAAVGSADAARSVQLLLSAGADASGRTHNGKTAVDLAVERGHIESIRVLRAAAATRQTR